MINLRNFALAAIAAAGVAAAAPSIAQSADGNDRRILIENRSGQSIVYVRGSPSTDPSFGADRIPDRVVRNGQRTIVNFDDGTSACLWDLRATLADGRHIDRMNVNVCRISRWTVNRRNSNLR